MRRATLTTPRGAFGVFVGARTILTRRLELMLARGSETGSPSSRIVRRFRRLFRVPQYSLLKHGYREACQAGKVVPDKISGHRGSVMHPCGTQVA